MRKNRKNLPKKQLADKQLVMVQGQFKSSFVSATWLKWMDKLAVNLLSNFHNGSKSKCYWKA